MCVCLWGPVPYADLPPLSLPLDAFLSGSSDIMRRRDRKQWPVGDGIEAGRDGRLTPIQVADPLGLQNLL